MRRRRDAMALPADSTYRVEGVPLWHLREEEQPHILDRYRQILASNREPFRVTLLTQIYPVDPAWPFPATRHHQVYLHTASPELRRRLSELSIRTTEVLHPSFIRTLLPFAGTSLSLREHASYIAMPSTYVRLYYVYEWPESFSPDLLRQLLPDGEQTTVSLSFWPLAAPVFRRHLRRLTEAAATGAASASVLAQSTGRTVRHEAESFWQALRTGSTCLYRVSAVLAIWGERVADVRQQGRVLEERCLQLGVGLRLARFRQIEALLSILHQAPAQSFWRYLDAAAISHLPWFAIGTGPPIPLPAAIGIDLTGPRPHPSNRLTRPNPSLFVLGQPGSGKSAFVKSQLLRAARQAGMSAVVIDPEGEYEAVLQEWVSSELEGTVATGRFLHLRGDISWQAVWSRIEENAQRGLTTHVVVDEAHLFLQDRRQRLELCTLVKRARKWGVLFTGISQNVHDFLASPEGRTILANAGEVLLFRQSALDLEPLTRLYQLSPSHRTFLARSGPGEALLVDATRVVPLRILLRHGEEPLVDTRPTRWLGTAWGGSEH